MLSAHGLNYSHGGSQAPLWRPLSFETGDARLVLLSGESGSGKSTLLRILCGLLPGFRGGRLEGRIDILGRPSAIHPDGRVGLLFQNADVMLHSPRVSDELLARANNSRRTALHLGRRPNLHNGWLAELVQELDLVRLLDKPILELSGGEQQRVALAAVLAARPEVVLLDEPTSNLDDRAAADLSRLVLRCIERFKTRFVVSEHRSEVLRPFVDGAVRLDGSMITGCCCWSGRAGEAPVEVLPARLDTEELRRLADSWRPDPHAEPLLVCRNLRCRRAGRLVLDGASLDLRPGEIVGLSGPNGAGKSTLLLLLAGGIRAASGSRIEWKTRAPRGAAGGAVGLLLQNPLHQLFCETVREEVALAAANAGFSLGGEIEALLAAADLVQLADRPSLSLSYGEQQRTALAAAMSGRPAVVLLDEPTHGTDARRLGRVVRFVIEARRAGTAFVVASHDRSLLEAFSDRVLTLNEGRLTEAACGHP